MADRISLEDVWKKTAQSFVDLGGAMSRKSPPDHILSHIAHLQSWLKVFKRKMEAQKRKEAQDG